jgi:hypothetical protein
MAWLSEVTAGNTIITNSSSYYQRYFFQTSGYMIRRLATRTETNYVGLTSAAADTQVTTSLAVSGVQSVTKQRENDAGAYRVIEDKETYGAWEYEETVEPVEPPA